MMGWGTVATSQTPVLNEMMSSNQLAHFDDFFESDDWVEIYNPGGLLDLAGHHISDDLQPDQVHVPRVRSRKHVHDAW